LAPPFGDDELRRCGVLCLFFGNYAGEVNEFVV